MSEHAKRCCTCKETKKLEFFYKNKSTADGHCHQCKACVDEYGKKESTRKRKKDARASPENKALERERRKKALDRNREKNNNKDPEDYPKNKFCPACKHSKDSSFFYKDRTRHDGLKSLCKSCTEARKPPLEKRKEYREKIKHKINESRKAYEERMKNNEEYKEKRLDSARRYRKKNKGNHGRKTVKQVSAEIRQRMTDSYIKSLICQSHKVKRSDITQCMIALVRQKVILERAIRQARENEKR